MGRVSTNIFVLTTVCEFVIEESLILHDCYDCYAWYATQKLKEKRRKGHILVCRETAIQLGFFQVTYKPLMILMF